MVGPFWLFGRLSPDVLAPIPTRSGASPSGNQLITWAPRLEGFCRGRPRLAGARELWLSTQCTLLPEESTITGPRYGA